MGNFRLWHLHTDEYTFLWNCFVGAYTFRQLSDAKRAEVYEHYGRVVALNQLDFFHDVGLGRYDPFWLAFTMADMGIAPLLGPKSTKWFYVTNPRRARALISQPGIGDEIGPKVMHDINQKHGLSLTPVDVVPEEYLDYEAQRQRQSENNISTRPDLKDHRTDAEILASIEATLARVRGETKPKSPTESSDNPF